MTANPQVRRNGFLALCTACAIVALVAWIRGRVAPSEHQQALHDYPELFVDVATCPSHGDPLQNGRRLEEIGLVRADRYAYDAGDGVRAVQRFREAETCYRGAGSQRDAVRVALLLRSLSDRVNTDYAAARLNLVTALDQRRWSNALSEINRLLLLTKHLGRDGYVEWLNQIIGKIAARAGSTP